MIDCIALSEIDNPVTPPVKEFLLLHGKKLISKQEIADSEKVLKMFEIGLNHFVDCQLVKPVEIKFVGEFLSNFCKFSSNYSELSERGQGYINAMYGLTENECMAKALECSGCIDE